MTDTSEDEFGTSLGTHHSACPSDPEATTNKKGTNRNAAGPSKPAPSGTGRGKKKVAASEDEDEAEVIEVSADEVAVPVKRGRPPKGAKKQTQSRSTAKAAEPAESSGAEEDHRTLQSNRATAAAGDDEEEEEVEEVVGRGKSKKSATTAQPARPRGRPKGKGAAAQRGTAAVDVSDGEDEVLAMEAESNRLTSTLSDAINLASSLAVPVRSSGAKQKGKENATRPTAKEVPHASQDKQIEDLRNELEKREKEILLLKEQLGDLHRVRMTEPEKLMEQMVQQHEHELRAKDGVIEQLTQRLSAKDSIFRNHTAKFELFTREEVEKETEKSREEAKKYRLRMQDMEADLKQKCKDVEEQQQIVREVQYELKVERENAAKAIRAPPPSVSKTTTGRADDPKQAVLIRFYEDLTNFLVTKLTIQPGPYLGVDEAALRCVYTYNDPTNPTPQGAKSLEFHLRLFADLKDKTKKPTHPSDLVDSVHYEPVNLNMLDPALVNSLDFLKGNFTFERTQLALFVRTMYDYMSGDDKDNDTSSEDVQMR